MSPLPANYLSLEDEPLYELISELWDHIEALNDRIDDLEASLPHK